MNSDAKNEKKQQRRGGKPLGRRTEEAIRAYTRAGTKTDVEGSYTGRPDPVFGQIPVQDADDL